LYPLFDDPKSDAMVNLVRDQGITDKKLLVPHDYLPMIHYYFPRTRLTPYRDLETIPSQLGAGSFDGVIYLGDPPRYQPATAVH
jgi:hypothetical protein